MTPKQESFIYKLISEKKEIPTKITNIFENALDPTILRSITSKQASEIIGELLKLDSKNAAEKQLEYKNSNITSTFYYITNKICKIENRSYSTKLTDKTKEKYQAKRDTINTILKDNGLKQVSSRKNCKIISAELGREIEPQELSDQIIAQIKLAL